ncbi:ribosomal-protein-alanine N-acetyltransferase [compost metagenome]|jgi:RimJ/RimL family protein N-acetyltransferase|uniref:GNAT family N-acetyltransferase n=1 Tax=Agrobacterium tumefaciens complex TaxID=1183400 RepID=UPI000DD6BC4D|nr:MULTISPECIES: GNAT family N-acetyltransferase [Agrobacterium tumefaciens complex]MBB4405737.1 RimJ/RimL family protein N-acetyltransferase [Agrobacterium radiobacter]MBB4450855.1 RimJ/RimL family protein N-acetyltransferase [Agrobacterium radiobacter]MDR6588159.1 RimJ/RimL family protein N-acetyltransferase [Agrobacterium tumefaciens]
MDTPPSTRSLSIIPATEADIPFIMSVERIPGYAALVGSYDADEHRRRIETANTNYFLCRLGTEPLGFAVVRLDDDGMGNAQLHRIAMARTGLGHGSAFLRQICRAVFAFQDIGRFWLDLLPSNVRARNVYQRIGFIQEGTMRQALRLKDGSREDLVLMSLLREEWRTLDG